MRKRDVAKPVVTVERVALDNDGARPRQLLLATVSHLAGHP
jgi:hypothetical protein